MRPRPPAISFYLLNFDDKPSLRLRLPACTILLADWHTRQIRKMLGRILLADDHWAVRKTLRALLMEFSASICGEAENGRQAIDKASELQPDLVILDLVMPEVNGLEAAYEIRQRAPSSKIILLSLHYSRQDGAALAKALGADAFVHKSALASDLVPAIGRLLSAKIGEPEAVLTRD